MSGASPSTVLRPRQHTQAMSAPTELNTSNHGHNLDISKDKLVVRYTGDARHANDVGAIQANAPVPTNCLIYYYELHVACAGELGRVSIGFSDKHFKLTRQPGWEPNSYGYHGDDGRKYFANGKGEEYGPRFGTGDTVGAGIHMGRQDMFFTRNGVKLKVAFRPVKAAGSLFPTIGLHSKNECVEVNFGAKPFKFDLEGMIVEEHQQQQAEIESTMLPSRVSHQVVRQYLLHYGYADTLAALDEACGGSPGASTSTGAEGAAAAAAAAPAPAGGGAGAAAAAASLQLRSAVRRHVLAGQVDAALQLVQQHFPAALQGAGGCTAATFWLSCQHFIELVRAGRVEDAVAYARLQLSSLQGKAPQREATLRDVVALVAYEQPEQSPLQHLLALQQREHVADVVNAAVLELQAGQAGTSTAVQGSVLEHLLQHLVVLHGALYEENGGMGEQFKLEEHLLQ